MPLKVVLAPYSDPSELDWDEQTPKILARLHEELAEAPGGSPEYELAETDRGIGADWPTITLEILKWAGGLLFSIPATHKIVRETLGEWKRIKENLDRFLEWLREREAVVSYSIDVAFLEALAYLDSSTSADNLEYVSATEIPGKSNALDPSFERSELVYYLFTFREGSEENAHVLLYNSRLERLGHHVLKLDPRMLIE